MAEALSQIEWFAEQLDSIPHSHEIITPSEWAEKNRYLPPSVSSMSGPFRFYRSPFLREIVDCFSVDSPIREVVMMKGVQVGATAGVIENVIGYFIAHVQTSPMMFVTADEGLAKLRLETNVIEMIQQSELSHLIKSADERNSRKTGSTAKKIEWVGGGFLLPLGANAPNKFRQTSAEVMLRDEIDGWQDGKQGDSLGLTDGRLKAYLKTRKVFDGGTPLLKGTSRIERRFLLGDQRHYFVRCLSCGFPQVLSGYDRSEKLTGDSFKWRRTDPVTGEQLGMVWDLDSNGHLIEESVRYCCANCGHGHSEHDKSQLFDPAHGAEWQPTATPSSPVIRSYHLSALYSMAQTWAECVRDWRKAWDDERNVPRDNAQMQVFYNNILGLTWWVQGDRVSLRNANGLRRPAYSYGQIPNRFAIAHTGAPISFLTLTVDVHDKSLPTAVIGWARGRAFLIDYWRLEGDTDQLDDTGTWCALRKIIEEKTYTADDGKVYRPHTRMTLIDSRGHRTDHVYRFCDRYNHSVYPILGVPETRSSAATRQHFKLNDNHPSGTLTCNITVDRYKDRWAPALRREWNGVDQMPDVFFNAPIDATEQQLREFTNENRQEVRDKQTNQTLGWEWKRTGPNELWDLLVYASAAVDMKAWDICRNELERDDVDWDEFWAIAETPGVFFEQG